MSSLWAEGPTAIAVISLRLLSFLLRASQNFLPVTDYMPIGRAWVHLQAGIFCSRGHGGKVYATASERSPRQSTERYKLRDPIYMHTKPTAHFCGYIREWWAREVWLEQTHPETVVTAGEEPGLGCRGGSNQRRLLLLVSRKYGQVHRACWLDTVCHCL